MTHQHRPDAPSSSTRVIIKVPMLTSPEVADRLLNAGRQIFPGCEVSVVACDDLLVYRSKEGK